MSIWLLLSNRPIQAVDRAPPTGSCHGLWRHGLYLPVWRGGTYLFSNPYLVCFAWSLHRSFGNHKEWQIQFCNHFSSKEAQKANRFSKKNFVQYHTYKIKVKAFTKSKTIVLLNLDLFPPLHSIAGELLADTVCWGRFNCWQRFPVEESRLMVSRARK